MTIVDLWFFDLNVMEPCFPSPGSCLSEDELQRAHRIPSVRHRQRFVRAREALRHVLGVVCDIAPIAVRFAYGPLGKPELSARGSVHFNLSHCDDVALIAVSASYPVGVDVERVRDNIELDRVVERLLSTEEARGLADLSPSKRQRALFTWWTRKEALVKMIGEGLTSFRAFEVPTARIGARVRAPAGADWSLHDFAVEPNMVGAIAVEGRNLRLRRRALS